MRFEVINNQGRVVMNTEYISCIPCDYILSSMSQAGYKFKLDEKIISLKKAKELSADYQKLKR